MDRTKNPAPGTWFNNKSISRKKNPKTKSLSASNHLASPLLPLSSSSDEHPTPNELNTIALANTRTSTTSHLANGAYENLYSDWPILIYALYWLLFTFPYIQFVRSLIGYRPINLGTLYEVTDASVSARRMRRFSTGHRSLRTQFDIVNSKKKDRKVSRYFSFIFDEKFIY